MASERNEYRLAGALRPVLPWLTAVLVIAVLWTAWIILNRRDEARQAEQEAANRKANLDREVIDRLGGDKLSILTFYASPPVIHRGTHVSLCYSVSNAASVVIDPGLGSWKPSLSRCLDVAPQHTTSYTLTAKGAKGDTLTADTKIVVQ